MGYLCIHGRSMGSTGINRVAVKELKTSYHNIGT